MRTLPVVVLLLTSVCACSPAAPAPLPAPLPAPSESPDPTAPLLSGTVFESAHGQPLSDVSVNAWVETRFASYSYWYLNGRPPSTDTRGRYELIEMPIGSTVYLDLHKTDYLQQCAFEITLDGTPQRLDAQLVRRESLFVSPDSAPSAPGFRNVYGVVYQNTGGGRVPAANSAVAFEAGPDFDAARTVTDARGRFLLCGLSRVRTLRIVAYGSGNRPAYHSVAPGPDEEIEIDVE